MVKASGVLLRRARHGRIRISARRPSVIQLPPSVRVIVSAVPLSANVTFVEIRGFKTSALIVTLTPDSVTSLASVVRVNTLPVMSEIS